jgi:hypothetical protein
MSTSRKYTGFAIALAWPETYCKQPGSWYDPVTGWLGITKNNYYKAGHAALVLINKEEQKCHYFDFGRYHAPFQHGRVRSAETDHELKMFTRPVISGNGREIVNFDEILAELQNNDACHGEGTLYASYAEINFENAWEKAISMQESSPLPYGPFVSQGSNCSRFVNSVILAGKPSLRSKFRLKYFVPLTPTPMNNINSLGSKKAVQKLTPWKPFSPHRKLTKNELISILPAPVRHPEIPQNAQWLSGEGAGSWFVVEHRESFLHITRYSPSGKKECLGYFSNTNGKSFDTGKSLQIIHSSNCRSIRLKVGNEEISFERIQDDLEKRQKGKQERIFAISSI